MLVRLRYSFQALLLRPRSLLTSPSPSFFRLPVAAEYSTKQKIADTHRVAAAAAVVVVVVFIAMIMIIINAVIIAIALGH